MKVFYDDYCLCVFKQMKGQTHAGNEPGSSLVCIHKLEFK